MKVFSVSRLLTFVAVAVVVLGASRKVMGQDAQEPAQSEDGAEPGIVSVAEDYWLGVRCGEIGRELRDELRSLTRLRVLS